MNFQDKDNKPETNHDAALETNEPLAPKDNPPIDNWNEEYPDVQELEEGIKAEIDDIGDDVEKNVDNEVEEDVAETEAELDDDAEDDD